MTNIPLSIAAKMDEYPPGCSVSIELNMNTYFDVIRGLVDIFAKQKDAYVFYISATIPSNKVMDLLELFEVDISRIYFVDCIAHIMMGATRTTDRILYVESPTMLETIMLKVEFLTRKYRDKTPIVVLDSVNSLAIHNDLKILSEFLHIFVTSLRGKGAYMIILSLKDQSTPEMAAMLNLVSDEVITVE
jgi:hypothetical protein